MKYLMLLVLVVGCSKPVSDKLTDEQIKAMWARAKADDSTEKAYVADSIALDSTFANQVVTASTTKLVPYDYQDDDDNEITGVDTLFYAVSQDSLQHSIKYCRVEKVKYAALSRQNLRCQWSDSMEVDQ